MSTLLWFSKQKSNFGKSFTENVEPTIYINTPEVWPEGCLYRPFFGALHTWQDVLQKDTPE